MTIVLPLGVLFRGDAEGEIRKQLLECNHIDAIIGLPANIFFGTGIPTIIMVLKKNRPNTDVMIIDASKGFAKVGKSNHLRASDIRRIADTVIGRITVAGYSRSVELSEIRNNDYNLNIPRYIRQQRRCGTLGYSCTDVRRHSGSGDRRTGFFTGTLCRDLGRHFSRGTVIPPSWQTGTLKPFLIIIRPFRISGKHLRMPFPGWWIF